MQQIIVDFGTLKLGGLSVPLRVHGYGLMLVLGFLLAILLARWRARRVGEDPDVLTQCGVLALIGGILGARIAYVIENWRVFRAAPLGEVLNITSGGLIYYGGVVLAAATVLAYLWIKRLPVRRYLDILAVSMMVGLAFGRAGCLLNGCCFGSLSRDGWPLSMRFPMYSRPLLKFDGRDNPYSFSTESPSPAYAHQMAAGQVEPPEELLDPYGRLVAPRDFTPGQVALAGTIYSRPVQPAQAMGIVNALLIASLLAGFFRLRTREGQVFALMLMLYPVTRFVLESIRDDNAHNLLAGVLTHNQYTSIITFFIGAAMMLALARRPASAGPTWARRIEATRPAQSKSRHKPRKNRKP